MKVLNREEIQTHMYELPLFVLKDSLRIGLEFCEKNPPHNANKYKHKLAQIKENIKDLIIIEKELEKD